MPDTGIKYFEDQVGVASFVHGACRFLNTDVNDCHHLHRLHLYIFHQRVVINDHLARLHQTRLPTSARVICSD